MSGGTPAACTTLTDCAQRRTALYAQFNDLATQLSLGTLEPIPALTSTGNCTNDTQACQTQVDQWLAYMNDISGALA